MPQNDRPIDHGMLLSFSTDLLQNVTFPRIMRLLEHIELTGACRLPCRGRIYTRNFRTNHTFILYDESQMDAMMNHLLTLASEEEISNDTASQLIGRINSVRIQEICLQEGTYVYLWRQSSLNRTDGIGTSLPLIMDGCGNYIATVSSWRTPL